jgi:hypothetical protein
MPIFMEAPLSCQVCHPRAPPRTGARRGTIYR